MITWAGLRVFKDACDAAGIEVPPPLTRGIQLIKVAEQSANPQTGGLLDLSDAEVNARVESYAIRHHDRNGQGSQRGMRPGIEDFTNELLAEVRAECMPHVNAIVENLRPAFAEKAAALVTAAQKGTVR